MNQRIAATINMFEVVINSNETNHFFVVRGDAMCPVRTTKGMCIEQIFVGALGYMPD